MIVKNVAIAGCGVLGSQIALQSAYCGFNVKIWVRSEASIERAKAQLERYRATYLGTMEAMKTNTAAYCRGFGPQKAYTAEEIDEMKARVQNAFDSLSFTLDYEEACKGTDLIIEAIAEEPKQKTAFYQAIAPFVEKDTVIVTNSSTLLPSMFAEASGRPDKYMAMHFANNIWQNNTSECMRHAGTSDETFETVLGFAKSINMIPLPVLKETPGYILNSLLVPFLDAAEALYVNGVAEPATIDLTWKCATGAPYGPFQILDVVGVTTAYNIKLMHPDANNPETITGKIVAMLKEKIDKGELGVATGKGFYDYTKKA